MIDDIALLRDGDDRGHDCVDLILSVQSAAGRSPDGVDEGQAGRSFATSSRSSFTLSGLSRSQPPYGS